MSDLPGPRGFATTHWSLVMAAATDAASRSRAREALEQLCGIYWYPLYAFVRSRGHSADDARDLTQSFFARILEAGGFATADPARGRFRSWLLGAMKHFLVNEWHRERAQKRGGRATFLELDGLGAEARWALEPAVPREPDAVFDKEWALESVARALASLRTESEARGAGALFAALEGCLTGDESPRRETAAKLGLTESAVKAAVHRLRQRYRAVLRAQIAQTVDDPSDIDDEMRYLLDALRARK
jgi:RNA polymerase sigma-70 factor (ECF subfamily)